MKKWFLIFVLCLSAAQAEARIYIRVDEVSEKKFPIAVTDLVDSGERRGGRNGAQEISQIIKKDLQLSGLFEFVDPKIFPPEDQNNYRPDEIQYSGWKLLGIQGVVKGGFSDDADGGVKVELYLYDPLVEEQLVGHIYTAKSNELRRVAHHFADLIMETLTGYPGIFRTRIAYVAKTGGAKEIYTMDVDGAAVARLTNERNITISPDWSPDGGRIVYTAYTKAGDAEIKIIDLGSKKATQVTNKGGINLSPTWTPDGRFITALVSNTEENIYNLSLAGRLIKRLTKHWGIDIAPSWAPDGGAFVFSSERAGGLHVFRADANGGNIQRLTFVGYQNDNPAWAPEGNRIVFQGRDQGVWDLFIMNSDGSMLQRLTSSAGHNQEPTWAPNGQYIAFSSNRTGADQIYIMTAQGENQIQISKSGGASQPDWGPLPKKGF